MSKQEDFHQTEKPLENTREIANDASIQLKFQCLLMDLRVLIGLYSKFY